MSKVWSECKCKEQDTTSEENAESQKCIVVILSQSSVFILEILTANSYQHINFQHSA